MSVPQKLKKQAKSIVDAARAAYPELPLEQILEPMRYKDLSDNSPLLRDLVAEELSDTLAQQDHALLLFLLKEEAKFSEACWCVSSNVSRIASMLYFFGKLEDILLIWETKNRTFDLGISLSANYFFGAGVEETFKYLEAQDFPERDKMLLYLRKEAERTSEYIKAFDERIQKRYAQSNL
jgi:hypothetical protein